MSEESQIHIDREIKLYNRLEEMPRLNEGLEEIGAAAGWSVRAVLDLQLACEEIVVNIVNYGFPSGGEHLIDVNIQASPSSIVIKIEDSGLPFNPLAGASEPLAQLNMDLNDRPIGGLGIFFVKRLMDDIHYERVEGINRFHMRKQWKPEDEINKKSVTGGDKG